MLVFPPEFMPLSKYPGYVWNLKDQRLYSFKSGQLHPLSLHKPFISPIVHHKEPYYTISHKGCKRHIPISRLHSMTDDYIIHQVSERKVAHGR